MRGENEMEMIKDLPEGLRLDIKRYLCLHLIKKITNLSRHLSVHKKENHVLSLGALCELFVQPPSETKACSSGLQQASVR